MRSCRETFRERTQLPPAGSRLVLLQKLRGESVRVVRVQPIHKLPVPHVRSRYGRQRDNEIASALQANVDHSIEMSSIHCTHKAIGLHDISADVSVQPMHDLEMPSLTASRKAASVQPSVRFECSHCTTSRCPFFAALSIASVVHPSFRFSCNHLTIPRCPLAAAPLIAALVQSWPLSASHCSIPRCPSVAAESMARSKQKRLASVLDEPLHFINKTVFGCHFNRSCRAALRTVDM